MGEAGRRARQAPSWMGTLVIAIAVAVLCLRAAAELRRAVAPAPTSRTGGELPETH